MIDLNNIHLAKGAQYSILDICEKDQKEQNLILFIERQYAMKTPKYHILDGRPAIYKSCWGTFFNLKIKVNVIAWFTMLYKHFFENNLKII